MEKQFVLIACGVVLGMTALVWLEPETNAGATLIIIVSIAITQVLGAVFKLCAPLLRRKRDLGAALIVTSCLAFSPALAQNSTLELLNKTRQAIKKVEAKPISQKQWSEVPLPLLGKRIPLSSLSQKGACVHDLRITFADGSIEVVREVNICRNNFFSALPDTMDITGNGDLDETLSHPLRTTKPSPGDAQGLPDPPTPQLWPGRVFLHSEDVPPPGVGAYGMVVLRSRPTEATKPKLTRFCEAFLAALPPRSELQTEKASAAQMLTVWPLTGKLPTDEPAPGRETCLALLDAYDLTAGEAALRDVQVQGVLLNGPGPFLVGWSPSNMRGVRDAIVLIVDMSGFEEAGSFEQAMLFWKRHVVDDPVLWRSGFFRERFRLSLREFADRYGTAVVSAIKLWGG